jgi:hypothetical protein
MRSHLLNLLAYSTLVSSFFALLLRRERRDQLRLGGMLWATMVGGALLLAWLMYPFPS